MIALITVQKLSCFGLVSAYLIAIMISWTQLNIVGVEVEFKSKVK